MSHNSGGQEDANSAKQLSNISRTELIELIAPGGTLTDPTGSWITGGGDEPAFGFPSFPFVYLRREQPWCEIRLFHEPLANSWIDIDVHNGELTCGEFPEDTTVDEALFVCTTLMKRSVDGVDSTFPVLVVDERPEARKQSLLERLFRCTPAIIALDNQGL